MKKAWPIAVGEQCKQWARRVVYGVGLGAPLAYLRSCRGYRQAHRAPEYWDQALRTSKAYYLGGTLTSDLRAAAIASVLTYSKTPLRTVLDVGCAGGELGRVLLEKNLERYIGIDISRHAIDVAGANSLSAWVNSGRVQLYASDLCDYKWGGGRCIDAIVFSEVLSYLDVNEINLQLERYASWLGDGGVICISLYADTKSRAIFRRVRSRFKWVTGVLLQVKCAPAYRFTGLHKQPTFLVGVLAQCAS